MIKRNYAPTWQNNKLHGEMKCMLEQAHMQFQDDMAGCPVLVNSLALFGASLGLGLWTKVTMWFWDTVPSPLTSITADNNDLKPGMCYDFSFLTYLIHALHALFIYASLPLLTRLTYALPPPSPYYMFHPLPQPSITRLTYALLTP